MEMDIKLYTLHLSAQNIKKGDTVAHGQQIGNGKYRRSTSPHLHFELLKENKSLIQQDSF